jgi:hypothetical protein
VDLDKALSKSILNLLGKGFCQAFLISKKLLE